MKRLGLFAAGVLFGTAAMLDGLAARVEAELGEPLTVVATGGLAPVRMNDGSMSKVPLMPFTLGGQRPGIRLQPPTLGEHTRRLLHEVGYSAEQIKTLVQQHITHAAE